MSELFFLGTNLTSVDVWKFCLWKFLGAKFSFDTNSSPGQVGSISQAKETSKNFHRNFNLQPLEASHDSLRFYQIIIHLDVPGVLVSISVCRHFTSPAFSNSELSQVSHLGPDSSSKKPRCWLMISSSLQWFRYQQRFQDLSWRYVVTRKMGTTTSIKYLYFRYLKSLDWWFCWNDLPGGRIASIFTVFFARPSEPRREWVLIQTK